MRLNVVLVLFFLGIVSSTRLSAQGNELDGMAPLPSEETMREINENYGYPELRAKPPGGGPAIGEVIVPVPDFNYIIFIILAVTSITYKIVKIRRSNKHHQ